MRKLKRKTNYINLYQVVTLALIGMLLTLVTCNKWIWVVASEGVTVP